MALHPSQSPEKTSRRPSLAAARMVERQIEARGVRDPRVLEAMRRVPRPAFMPEGYDPWADAPAPIACGQTISQPYIVARMTELLEVEPGMSVLEIGVGSGYQTAVLAEMGADVYGIERHEALAENARITLGSLGYQAHIHTGDGLLGWPEPRTFDRMLAAAGAPAVPRELLLRQLADGGRAVLPIGSMHDQRLALVHRRGDQFDTEELEPVRFVPLIGQGGWSEE